ncbi:MAG: hypothetical protein ACREFL_04280 [Stellaceae bacterium]
MFNSITVDGSGMDDIPSLEETSSVARRNALPQPVPLAQVWRWVAPGVFCVVLAVIVFVGLWSASGTADGATEAVGFATAGLAMIALIWGLKAQFDRALWSLLVSRGDSLVVLSGLLATLAIIGLVVAARGEGVTLTSAGYALFILSVALIGLSLRHYFDCRDDARDAASETAPHEHES